MNKEIEELRKTMDGHKMTDIQKSAVEWVFKQALTSYTEELKKKIEGKRVDTAVMSRNLPEGNGINYAIARRELESAFDFNKGIDAALSELNHQ